MGFTFSTPKGLVLRVALSLFLAAVLAGCADIDATPSEGRGRRIEPAPPLVPGPDGWMPLFDGKTLRGWRTEAEGDFGDREPVRVEDGAIVLEQGAPSVGIAWTGDLPRGGYEVSLEAKRTSGGDFFCGLTFPVGDAPCTLIVGGWGGTVVGLSNVDHQHAAENETTTTMEFENDRWYRIRLRVARDRIQAWIDDERVVDLARADRTFTIWWEQEPMKPLGIATWYTGSALRGIRIRRLAEGA